MSVGLDGPLFFGSVDAIRREFRRFEQDYPDQVNMIFVVRGAGQLDMPAAELLIEEADRRRARGGNLYVQTKIVRTIKQLEEYNVTEHLGNSKVHLSKGDAISDAFPTLDKSICAKCAFRIFSECPKTETG